MRYDELKHRRIVKAIGRVQLNSAAFRIGLIDYCMENGLGEALAQELDCKVRELPRVRAALVDRAREWTRRSVRGAS